MRKLDKQLFEAIDNGDVERVRTVLAWGADVNARNEEHGETALMVCAMFGSSEVLLELLKADADVSLENRFGNTALILAVFHKNNEHVKILLDYKADVNHQTKDKRFSPLSAAMTYNNREVISLLMAEDIDFAQTNDKNETAFVLASKFGDLNLMKDILLRYSPPAEEVHTARLNADKKVMQFLEQLELDGINGYAAPQIDLNAL